MMLIEETPLPEAALPVEVFKAHLRLSSGFGFDDLQDEVLDSFLRAAIAAIEVRTGKALIARGFQGLINAWREVVAQPFPIAPVTSIEDVVLIASDGAEKSEDVASYWLEQDAHCPRVRATGARLPAVPQHGRARLEFTAGIAQDWDGLPPDLRQAVLLLAAHYYEFRSETALSEGCMPFGVSSLIERYRALRIGGAA